VVRAGAVGGEACDLVGLHECEVLLLDWSSQVTVEDCHVCKLLLGPVDGSVMMRNCSRVEVHAACRQFRCRDCQDCTARLFTPGPIIESSVRMLFGPWDAGYAGLRAQLRAANLISYVDSPEKNEYDKVFDFTADDESLPVPHWSLLLPSQWDRWQPHVDDEELDAAPPEFPLPLPSGVAVDPPAKKEALAIEGLATAAVATEDPIAIMSPSELTGQASAPEARPRSAPASSHRPLEGADTQELPRPSSAAIKPPRPGSAKGARTPFTLPVAEVKPSSLFLPPPDPSPSEWIRVVVGEEEVNEMHKLLLGDSGRDWPEAWRRQGFSFSTEPAVPYGLHQRRGGSCGVVAVVQAFVLRYLRQKCNGWIEHVSPSDQSAALVDALVAVMWMGANAPRGCSVFLSSSIALPARRAVASALTRYSIATKPLLRRFVETHLSSFMTGDSCGVILLVYSVVATVGVENVRAHMDHKETALIGAHGYCTQELVNLLLTGEATSNVFDGEQLVGEGDEMMSLHGIKERAPVGLLALNEAHGHCTVGDNYKSPEEPIWLCFMESHYSVLFGIEMPPAHGPFDLHFYDELGNQDEHIRLTIDPGREALPPANHDLVPPLELTIRTKWAHAFIDWNGTDPLL